MVQISDEISCNLALKMLYDMFNKTRNQKTLGLRSEEVVSLQTCEYWSLMLANDAVKNMCGLILDLIATIYIQQRDLEVSTSVNNCLCF